jgi:hypothetical protein
MLFERAEVACGTWTKAGAQALLHVKTAVLNGALHRYTRHIEPGAAAA